MAIRRRTIAFLVPLMALMTLVRAMRPDPGEVPVAVLLAGAVLVGFLLLRRRWMREYREALTAAGIDPERDELVEQATGFKNTMLILFGVFGGMFLFLTVFIWLARR